MRSCPRSRWSSCRRRRAWCSSSPSNNRDAGAGRARMADPRFYDNKGPFSLKRICEAAGVDVPAGGDALVHDIASLDGAGPGHLSFFAGAAAAEQFAHTRVGFCFVAKDEKRAASQGCVAIPCASVQHAFAAAAALFYPQSSLARWEQAGAIHPTARIGEGAVLAPGVVLGPNRSEEH